jgi:hypothetical protein
VSKVPRRTHTENLLLLFIRLAEQAHRNVLFILFPDSSRGFYAALPAYVMVLHRSSFQAAGRFMFSILRFVLIVGAIFYYSPVRQQGEGTAAVEAFLTPKKSQPAAGGPASGADNAGHLETVWKALPDSAKQAVVDRILTTSGFPVAGSTKSSDTLRPEDREPAASKPRT